MTPNSFDAKATLSVGERSYEIFRLDALQAEFDVARLPFSLKILLENLLRHEDGESVRAAGHRGARRAGTRRPSRARRSRSRPARVLLQDFTGVPAVVDLAAMRDAMRDDGRRPEQDQPARAGRARHRPLGPGRRVRHAARVRAQRRARVRAQPGALRVPALGPERVPTTSASCRRTPASSTRSTSSTSRASCSATTGASPSLAYPDTLVGTDSHTTMINGLGVLGWGVGGIEAEAAMLGQPMSMLIPQVVGFKLTGELPGGRDRDRPRAHRHRDAAQEGRRRQVRRVLRRRARATCRSPTARRSATCRPEYGATCAIFPIDAETLRYLEFTGRPERADRARRGVRQGAGPVARRARRGADVHRHARARPRRPSSRASPARSARRTASR